jgi:AcrR family transcriptional regulator
MPADRLAPAMGPACAHGIVSSRGELVGWLRRGFARTRRVPYRPDALAGTDGSLAKRPKLTRAEKSRKIRDDLFDAAAKVVGEVGYANAMVATITARAEVAQGTFYNYFDSRQDLFDQLLPSLGRQMLDFIKAATTGAQSEVEREELGFRAFFGFLKVHPEFYRILYEAETFAPVAFRQHVETVSTNYVRVLKRARDRGEIPRQNDRRLEAIANILMGARHYLCMRYARRDGAHADPPEWVMQTYMDLVKHGLYQPGRELPQSF